MSSVSLRAGITTPNNAMSADLNINRGQALTGDRIQKKTFGQRFGSVLKNVAQTGLSVAGAVIPGAAPIASAIGGALGGSNLGNTPGLDGGDLMSQMMSQNMQFLALQNGMQQESRKYQTISNSLKASHDAAMASIRNIK
jgi:hypothetical protein